MVFAEQDLKQHILSMASQPPPPFNDLCNRRVHIGLFGKVQLFFLTSVSLGGTDVKKT